VPGKPKHDPPLSHIARGPKAVKAARRPGSTKTTNQFGICRVAPGSILSEDRKPEAFRFGPRCCHGSILGRSLFQHACENASLPACSPTARHAGHEPPKVRIGPQQLAAGGDQSIHLLVGQREAGGHLIEELPLLRLGNVPVSSLSSLTRVSEKGRVNISPGGSESISFESIRAMQFAKQLDGGFKQKDADGHSYSGLLRFCYKEDS
jgi:hypothetical protein